MVVIRIEMSRKQMVTGIKKQSRKSYQSNVNLTFLLAITAKLRRP